MNSNQIVFLLIICQCCFLATVKPLEVPKHMKSGAKRLINLCMKETEATKEMFVEAKETGQLSSDNRLQCFMHCMLDKLGLIDNENIVHLDNLLEILPTEFLSMVEKLHTTCGTQSGADGCETAFLTVNCYIKTDPMILKLWFGVFYE